MFPPPEVGVLYREWNNHSGNQKIKCRDCNYCFVKCRIRRGEKLFRLDSRFHEYIFEGYSVRQISIQLGKEEQFAHLDIQIRLGNNRIICIDELFENVGCCMDGASWMRFSSYIAHIISERLRSLVLQVKKEKSDCSRFENFHGFISIQHRSLCSRMVDRASSPPYGKRILKRLSNVVSCICKDRFSTMFQEIRRSRQGKTWFGL